MAKEVTEKRKCKRCGKMFSRVSGYSHCKSCRKKNRRKGKQYVSSIPTAQQIELAEALESGETPESIKERTGLNIRSIHAFQERGSIDFRYNENNEPWHCSGCGAKILTEVCILCDAHKMRGKL